MSEVDTTLQAFLGVYRAEINGLEDKVGVLEGQLASAGHRETQVLSKVDELDRENDRLREMIGGKAEKIEKLNSVVGSLKLELAAEREAHSKLRDGAGPKPMPGTSA